MPFNSFNINQMQRQSIFFLWLLKVLIRPSVQRMLRVLLLLLLILLLLRQDFRHPTPTTSWWPCMQHASSVHAPCTHHARSMHAPFTLRARSMQPSLHTSYTLCAPSVHAPYTLCGSLHTPPTLPHKKKSNFLAGLEGSHLLVPKGLTDSAAGVRKSCP